MADDAPRGRKRTVLLVVLVILLMLLIPLCCGGSCCCANVLEVVRTVKHCMDHPDDPRCRADGDWD